MNALVLSYRERKKLIHWECYNYWAMPNIKTSGPRQVLPVVGSPCPTLFISETTKLLTEQNTAASADRERAEKRQAEIEQDIAYVMTAIIQLGRSPG